MTHQQLQYILTLHEFGHFGKAAAHLHVTQPTLSMMIKKLEDELEVVLFDRRRYPIEPTEIGRAVIEQAKKVIHEKEKIYDIVRGSTEHLNGNLRIGIIPTLAPYLAPRFLSSFLDTHSDVTINLTEDITDQLVEQLLQGKIDVAILITPLENEKLNEIPLFLEEFFVYSTLPVTKKYIVPTEIDPNHLWLLEEGHCFRSQVLNLCELKEHHQSQLRYKAGSIETLRQIVNYYGGMTIVPELASFHMPEYEQDRLYRFVKPSPARQVSLVVGKNHLKGTFIDALKKHILQNIPDYLLRRKKKLQTIKIKQSHAK